MGRAQNTKPALRLSGPCHPALRNKLPERPRGCQLGAAGGPGQQEHAPRPRWPLDRRRRPGSSPTCHRDHPCGRKARPATFKSARLRERGQSPHLSAGPTGRDRAQQSGRLSKVQRDHAAHGARGGPALPRGELPALPREGYLQAGGG